MGATTTARTIIITRCSIVCELLKRSTISCLLEPLPNAFWVNASARRINGVAASNRMTAVLSARLRLVFENPPNESMSIPRTFRNAATEKTMTKVKRKLRTRSQFSFYFSHRLLRRGVPKGSRNRHRFVRRVFENESQAGAEHCSHSIARGHAVDPSGGGVDPKCVRQRLEQTGDCRSFQQLAHDPAGRDDYPPGLRG